MTGPIPDLLAKRAELCGTAVALEHAPSGARLSFAELDRQAARAAAFLASHGVRAGNRVGILCRNRFAFFELLFGCARLGAILVPLNWRMPPAELDRLVEDCAPALILHDGDKLAKVQALSASPPTIDLDGAYESWSGPPLSQARTLWDGDSIWYLIYTSGTTGAPKGVIYTFGMAVANYVNIGSAIDIRSTDTTANFLPIFHTAGINLHCLPTLIAGGRVLVLDGAETGALVSLLRDGRLDTFFAVPTVYQALLDHPEFPAVPLGRVRHWGCGGAALPEALAERYRLLGVRLCAGMGMTETGPTALLSDPGDAWDRPGSVGKPRLLCRARIVDDEDRELPAGQIGEVQFKGAAVTPGYWNDEKATRAAFTDDGWLRSGDLARRDADGFYYVAGRRKEMFVSGGENVYPIEVENVLAAHPAVAEAAVVAVPDPKWGEVGRAFIRPAPDAAPQMEALEDFCRSRLARYKVPKSFMLVSDFPRTAAGKIQKHLLLDRSRAQG